MSDQRILSIAALVLLLVALLLPWPIAALGRAEPALAFAAVAALASLGFAWLGRRESLGRLVLKLAGGTAAIAFPIVGLLWGAHEASVARNRAHEGAMLGWQEVTWTDGTKLHIPVPATVPQNSMPRVTPGPDPMPVVTWPAGGQPAAMPPVATTIRTTPEGGIVTPSVPTETAAPTIVPPSDASASRPD